MKPNDKAIEAGVKLCWDCPRATPSMIRDILTAAYAAQFPPSEDYAGLVKWLRDKAESLSEIYPPEAEAADAIEALLAERDELDKWLRESKQNFMRVDIERNNLRAERDALLAELEACKKGNDSYHDQSIENHNKQVELNKRIGQLGDENKILAKACAGKYVDIGEFEGDKLKHMLYNTIIERNEAVFERDALLARLAPVDDEELVEIVAYYFTDGSSWSALSERLRNICRRDARNVIAAIRPHIEAAERERCAMIAERKKKQKYYDPNSIGWEGEWEIVDEFPKDGKEIAAAIRSGK